MNVELMLREYGGVLLDMRLIEGGWGVSWDFVDGMMVYDFCLVMLGLMWLVICDWVVYRVLCVMMF